MLAFAYRPTEDERILGLVVLDSDGRAQGVPCGVPPSMTVVNEPDIACVSGYCAVVWMEASAYDATDYITRIAQFPATPDLICP